MNSYSLENMKFDGNTYSVFQTTVVDNKEKVIFSTIVRDVEAMRIDRLCDRIYGTTSYVEEIMVLNNILNPWTIKEGDEILYFGINEEVKMRETEDVNEEETRKSLVNKNRKTKKDPNRSENLTPNIKPKELKPLIVNKENHKIIINNKLS